MDVAFTSDLHLGHDKDFIWEARGFSSIHEHDRYIKATLRAFECSHMYILGDLLMGTRKAERMANFLASLPYPTTVIVGNHDPKVGVLTDEGINARSSETLYIMLMGKMRCVSLAHLPANFVDHRGRDFSKLAPSDDGGILFHGHTHAKAKTSVTPNQTLQVSVGWDSWGKPVTVTDIDLWLAPLSKTF